MTAAALLSLVLSITTPAYSQDLSTTKMKELGPGQAGWLLEFAGRPATAVTADPRFAAIENKALSILKAQFDL
jgi:hypothetical protein